MKKKNNTYPFLNIIKREKYDNFTQDEKEKYLLDSKIYTRREDLNFPCYTLPDENGNILIEDFFYVNHVSKVVVREMITWFKEFDCDWISEFYGYEHDFEHRIERALDNSDKERIIRNDYEEYSDLLNNDRTTKNYFSINAREGDIYDCISAFRNEEEVIEYITKERPFLSVMLPFENCEQIKIWVEILKFLKKEMNKITGSIEEKVLKPKSTTPLPFNDKIFRTMEAQNWFHDTLNKMGAIEDHNKPKRRKFQPICSAIFYSISCKKHILKYGLKLEDLINFLNKEFKTKIKTKLSVGHLHEDEVSKNIEKFIENNNLA